MPSKKKGTYQGKAESPTLGQQKLPCNYVTNPLVPTTHCVTNPLVPTNNCTQYLRELGLGAFRPHTLGEGGGPWLESVINSPIAIAICIVSRRLLSRPGTRTMDKTLTAFKSKEARELIQDSCFWGSASGNSETKHCFVSQVSAREAPPSSVYRRRCDLT